MFARESPQATVPVYAILDLTRNVPEAAAAPQHRQFSHIKLPRKHLIEIRISILTFHRIRVIIFHYFSFFLVEFILRS